MLKKSMLILLVLVVLSACAPAIQASPGQSQPTTMTRPTLTVQPTATFTPQPTPTLTPTATPYARGGIPRIAIMTQSFMDGTNPTGKDMELTIRIGYLEPGGNTIKFSNDEIFVCIQPYLERTCEQSQYAPLRWSPNGRYLAYVSPGENTQVWINIYDAQEKKLVREVLVNRKNIYNVFDLGWSPDSAWVHAKLEDYLYVVGVESDVVLSASPNRVQSPRWDAGKSILYFEDRQGSKFFQFDPSKNQTSEAPRQKIKRDSSWTSWNSYGHYEPALKSEIAEVGGKDETRSIYIFPDDGGTPTEFLRFRRGAYYQDVRILPAPDGSSYLFGGFGLANVEEDRNNYFNYLFGLVIPANNLPYQASGDFVNGVLPLAWAPNSQSYLGLNFFISNSKVTKRLTVMDAASNQPLQQYDLYSRDIFNKYNFSTNVNYMQGRGVTGLDVFWPSQPEAFAPIKKPYAIYTMTPTPTEMPEWAALEKLKLYDDFSNNNLEKWNVLPNWQADAKQVTGFIQAKDGSLVFDPNVALSYAEIELRPRQVGELNSQTGIVFEMRFKLEGASQNSFRFELNSGIDGQVINIRCDNAWGSPDFYCGVVGGPDFEYRTAPIPITVGEWHKGRIEIDPQTAAIQFYFDDALIGRHTPNDFVRLKQASYLPAIIFGIRQTSAPILVDDIYLGTASGAVQYLPTFTSTPQP